MVKKHGICGALSAALIVLVPAALEAASIRVWEDANFSGASQVFDTATSRLEFGWNDRVSSLRVESGQWEVCRDADFRNCRTVGVDTPDLASLGSGWNDAISSLRPVAGAAVASRPQEVAERLYRALLGREADPRGLQNATELVADDRAGDLVRSLIQSDEYATATARLSAAETLDQIYNGLLSRPAGQAGRDTYLEDVEDGEVADVVLDILASEEFATRVAGGPGVPGGGVGDPVDPAGGIQVQARGEGTVIWGAKGRPQDVDAAQVQLGEGGRYRIEFSGDRPHQLDGTYVRESDDRFRLLTAVMPTRPEIEVEGVVLLENGQLARVDVTSGTQGEGDRMLYTFVAQGYELPPGQAACQDAIRSRLGGDEELAFLSPAHSRNRAGAWDISGEVVILSQNESARYRCEIAARGDEVLQATVSGM